MRLLHPGHDPGGQGVPRRTSAACSEAEVREALAGKLCRCTGYQKIVDAVSGRQRAAWPAGRWRHEQPRTPRRRPVAAAHRRARQGHRQRGLCRRLRAARHAVRQDPAQREPHARLVRIDDRASRGAARRARDHHRGRRRRRALRRRGQGRAGLRRGRASASRASRSRRSPRSPWRPRRRRWPRSRWCTSRCRRCSTWPRRSRPARRSSTRAGPTTPALPILQRDGNVCNRARIVVRRRRARLGGGRPRLRAPLHHRAWCTRAIPSRARRSRRGTARARSRCGRTPSCRSTCRATLAEILATAPSKVRVIVPGVGGGFGGKLRVGVEHFAALLARKSGRPVKVMTTSEEELTAAYPRQADGHRAQDRGHARRPAHRAAGPNLLRHRRLRRLGAGRGVGGDDGAGRALPHAEPAPRGLRGLHQQDQLRLLSRPVRASGQLRGRVADGHHRRRARHRPAGAAAAQHRARGRRGADRRRC